MSIGYSLYLETDASAEEILRTIPDEDRRPNPFGPEHWHIFENTSLMIWQPGTDGGDGPVRFEIDGAPKMLLPTISLIGTYASDWRQRDSDRLSLLDLTMKIRWQVDGAGLLVDDSFVHLAWRDSSTWLNRSNTPALDGALKRLLAQSGGGSTRFASITG